MRDIRDFKDELKNMESAYHQRVGQKQQLEQERAELVVEVENLKNQTRMFEEARILLQKAGTEARESARKRLEETVSDALRYVFGPDFTFEIELKESRGRTEAEFYVSSVYNGDTVRVKPEEARGGGVVDIISIALRIAMIQIYSNPNIKGPIILDEPGKHVSADYTMKLATFLKQMTQTFGRQIILSTHQPDLAHIADESHMVEIKGGKSVVTSKHTP